MELSEVAPPGREKQVKALKKEFPGDKEAPYKIAWSQYKKEMNEGKRSCPEGQYYCFDMGKCRPIPKGHKVREDGELIKEEDTFTQKTKELKRTKAARKHRYNSLHSSTNKDTNVDVNESLGSAIKKVLNRKKKPVKKHVYPTASVDKKIKKKREEWDQSEREKYVSPFKPVHHEGKSWNEFKKHI